MRRLLITNLSHMRRSDCNLPLKLDIKVKAVRMIGNSKHTAGGLNLYI